GNDGPDIGYGHQSVFVRLHERLDAAEVPGQVSRSALADMTNPKGVQQTVQRRLTRLVDGLHELLRRALAHAFKTGQLLDRQCEDICQGMHSPTVDQLVHQLFAKAFNVQGAATYCMRQSLLALRS